MDFNNDLKLEVILKLNTSVLVLEERIKSCIDTFHKKYGEKSDNKVLKQLESYIPLIKTQKDLILQLQTSTEIQNFSRIITLINELSCMIREDAIKCTYYMETGEWIEEAIDEDLN